ncbi:CATRA conflict system CASPASE/TPR repeat-associated protein [Micromonospora okii]|uniref:CATRA conflict system CASPASE/TPR repeat-associated protein n=1 Tax=Micromonospora okii TaxID=1182970 RepID=UPI001E28EEF2|nr:CATRA conflict system CASPASE/TPR repeat-associated protein [Micromonospora okii]
MTDPPADQSLVLHLFAPRTGPDRAAARDELLRLWAACGTALGMTESISGTGLPVEPPPAEPPPAEPAGATAEGAVAARRHRTYRLWQAVWIDDHDVSVVSVALGATGSPAADWRELHARWSDAVAGLSPERTLGTVEEFTGLSAAPADTATARGRLGRAVAALLPDPVPDGGPQDAVAAWAGRGAALRDGVTLWQTTLPGGDAPARRLVLLAAPRRDAELGRLVYTDGSPSLAPLTRYLLHSVKLRYQIRVWRAEQPRTRALLDHAETAIGQLSRLLLGAPGGADDRDTDHAEQQLAALQADERGLIDTAALTRIMRRTAQIAAGNLAAHAAGLAGEPQRTAPQHPFAADQAAASWFDQQLDDDLTYLDAARDRAQQLGAAADRELRRRGDAAAQAARRRQETFGLLQAAVVGAAVMCLTAIQSLEYKLPLAASVKPAFVAALGALTFHLSARAVRLARSGHGDRPARTPALEYLSTAVFGAALGWLGATWTVRVASAQVAPPTVTIRAALAGALLALAWAAWRAWRGRAARRRDPA